MKRKVWLIILGLLVGAGEVCAQTVIWNQSYAMHKDQDSRCIFGWGLVDPGGATSCQPGALMWRADDQNFYQYVNRTWTRWLPGGGGVAGSDTQIQFHDAGAFGGDPNFTWNKTTNQLLVNGGLQHGSDQAGTTLLTWNVTPATCTGDAFGGALTVNGLGEVVCSGDGGGDGAVAGSDTQVQFNDAAAFGADADFVWNKTSDILTLTDLATSGGLLRTGRGDATLPSISPMDDTNTGMWFGNSDQISLGTGGTERFIITGATQASMLRIEGDFVAIGTALGKGLGFYSGGTSQAGLRLLAAVNRLGFGHGANNNVVAAMTGIQFAKTDSTTVANTVTETTLIGTANGVGVEQTANGNFSLVGRGQRFIVRGVIANTGTPTIRLRFKVEGTTIIDTGAITMSAITGTMGWKFEGEWTARASGGAAASIGNGEFSYSTAAGVTVTHLTTHSSTTNLNLDSNTTNDVTVEWGTASSSNTITATNMIVEVLN